MTDSESDIFIVTTPEYIQRLNVRGYSNAFNLSKYELEGRIIYAPAGTDFGKYNGESVYAVVLDRRSILVGLKYWLASSFFVPNTYWVNHFLNVEILKGYNTIFNCVAITGVAIDNFFSKVNTAYISTTSITGYSEIKFVTDGTLVGESLYDNATYFEVSNTTNQLEVVIKFNGTEIARCTNGNTIKLMPLLEGVYELNTQIFG